MVKIRFWDRLFWIWESGERLGYEWKHFVVKVEGSWLVSRGVFLLEGLRWDRGSFQGCSYERCKGERGKFRAGCFNGFWPVEVRKRFF